MRKSRRCCSLRQPLRRLLLLAGARATDKADSKLSSAAVNVAITRLRFCSSDETEEMHSTPSVGERQLLVLAPLPDQAKAMHEAANRNELRSQLEQGASIDALATNAPRRCSAPRANATARPQRSSSSKERRSAQPARGSSRRCITRALKAKAEVAALLLDNSAEIDQATAGAQSAHALFERGGDHERKPRSKSRRHKNASLLHASASGNASVSRGVGVRVSLSDCRILARRRRIQRSGRAKSSWQREWRRWKACFNRCSPCCLPNHLQQSIKLGVVAHRIQLQLAADTLLGRREMSACLLSVPSRAAAGPRRASALVL